MAAADDDELIVAPNQPTYEPGEDGVTVTPIPVMIRKPKKKREKDPKGERHA